LALIANDIKAFGFAGGRGILTFPNLPLRGRFGNVRAFFDCIVHETGLTALYKEF